MWIKGLIQTFLKEILIYLRLEEEEKEEAVKEKNEKVKLMKRMKKEIEKETEEDSSILPTAPLMGNIQILNLNTA